MPSESKPKVRSKVHDGAVLRALRERQFGRRSSGLMAEMFRSKTTYKVHREHISAYEKGLRDLPDALILCASKVFGVPPELFPQYTARHISPEQVAHPLVAWALLKVRAGMTPAEGREFVARTEHIKGDYAPLIVETLAQQGIRTVDLPRKSLTAGV